MNLPDKQHTHNPHLKVTKRNEACKQQSESQMKVTLTLWMFPIIILSKVLALTTALSGYTQTC